MRQKIALSWLIPTAMILLMHTLVPHSHDFISHHKQQTCEHQHHGFWEFVEHLLHQNCDENHLEYCQIVIKNDLEIDNSNLLIISQLPTFLINDYLSLLKITFPLTDFNLKNPFLLKSLSLRGPPFC